MISSKYINSTISQTYKTQKKHHDTNGIVYDIILDENSKILSERNIPVEERIDFIGAVIFRDDNSSTYSEDLLPIAFPKNLTINRFPVRNERVVITTSVSGIFYYDIVSVVDNLNVTNVDNAISNDYVIEQSDVSSDYSKVFSNSIPRSNAELSDTNGYGEYFQFIDNVHKLKLYEGDTLIQSRFGQSIRLSGYNNNKLTYSPCIIIRNGESWVSRNDTNISVSEDINRDNSIIVLSSTGNSLPFKPGTIDKSGKSDFKTAPSVFKNYPNTYDGNQILLNSDRLIFSARSQEMIFYSKKNYGFISDGGMSINNAGGIDINCGANISIDTNNSDVSINTGVGKINLGDSQLEPIVKGDKLVSILNELIDAILQQSYLTPVGPTSVAPVNFASFVQIKTKLQTILSRLNKTS